MSVFVCVQVREVSEELEFSNQLFHDLSVYCDSVKSQLNHAKDVLVCVCVGVCVCVRVCVCWCVCVCVCVCV